MNTRFLFLLAGVLALSGCFVGKEKAKVDPLDQVTGTEGWHIAATERVEKEWKDWYRFRVQWRRHSREIRIQRTTNIRLARLLVDAQIGPSYPEVMAILRAGTQQMRGVPQSAPAPQDTARPPRRGGGLKPRTVPPPSPPARRPREQVPVFNGSSPPAEGYPEQDTDEPQTWTEVPVERLDDKGQAIDPEGDAELDRLTEE